MNNMSIASRIFIAFSSIVLLVFSYINLGLGQRELTYSYREWMYVISMINSLIIGTLAIAPRLALKSVVVKGVYTIAIAFAVYEVLLVLERASYRSALVAVVTAMFGAALAASAAYLLLRSEQTNRG